TDAPVVDHRETDWARLFDSIEDTPGVRVAILNHARDLHSGVRPFAPENHIALVGENRHGWPLRFNAMEVINSGATQTDPLQLCHDWMGLLNRGLAVTPVGSSDSHDVSRLFVGQGRTYIRTEDRDPGNINVDDAIASFRQGRVLVSYGLLTELTVQGRFRSGDVATDLPAEVDVRVNVRGPEWAQARRVQLYANGRVIREPDISPLPEADLTPGIKWRGGWTIPRPMHDMHLVAIATGPGIEGWHWRTAKPYQPMSPDPATTIFGLSGAVWLDVDGDGPTSARAYAERAITTAGTDWAKLLPQLDRFDETIAAQAAHLTGVKSPIPAELTEMLRTASPATRAGFEEYATAWRESQISRGR
ncbi:MAG TPA: hypothetical protein VM510_10300, partial [Caulifigura sp.]|nr:hypothetical protein [Caulifigura sp.]